MKKGVKVKKFLLEIPEEIWNKWKDKVPRSISLNKALIELLKKEGHQVIEFSMKDEKNEPSKFSDFFLGNINKKVRQNLACQVAKI